MSVNINCNVKDEFYRYKMPRLNTKVEGRGNGIKTVLVNMSEVSRALSVSPSYPTKFFGCELGSQTIMDEVKDRFVVNGSHPESTIRDLLNKFIKKYILCPECELPELVTGVKSQLYQGCCGACGWKGPLDNQHKLAAYIMKHPPKQVSLDKKGKGGTSTEKGKGATRKDRKKLTKKEEAAAAAAEKKKKEKKERKKVVEEENDDEDWGVDVSEEAVRKRREEMEADCSGAVKNLIANEIDYMEMSTEERLKLFKEFISQPKSNKELWDEATRLDVNDVAIPVILELKVGKDAVKNIKAQTALLQMFCKSKEAQSTLLGATERLVSVTHPALITEMNKILHLYYEEDIVDESIILAWSSQSSSTYTSNNLMFKKILANSKKFIEWLENAESESDSDEEDDGIAFGAADEVTGAGDDDDSSDDGVAKATARGNSSKYVIPVVVPAPADDDDDLDIDDI